MIDTNEMRNSLGEALVTPGLTILALLDEIDRLRAKPKPLGKTVSVRVPVAVEKSGYWRAAPRPSTDQLKEYMTDDYVIYWLTADLPIPEETTVEAEVENGQSK